MRVALVGGTGAFGVALAKRLLAAGHEVVIGSRDPERAASIASDLGCEGAANEDAVRSADIVVLATKADGAVEAAAAWGEPGDFVTVRIERAGPYDLFGRASAHVERSAAARPAPSMSTAADDATLIDTTGLTIDQDVEAIAELVTKARA